MRTEKLLLDRHIMLVEDEYFIAQELCKIVKDAGATVIGPFSGMSDKQIAGAISDADAAVLDINIRGKLSYDLADDLFRRRVPFLFATGYDAGSIPKRFADIPVLQKPFVEIALIRHLSEFCRDRASPSEQPHN